MIEKKTTEFIFSYLASPQFLLFATLSVFETLRHAACLFFRMKLQFLLACRRTQI